MKKNLLAWLLLGAAALVLLAACATLFAMIRALSVSTTLAAIESAFGSFVLLIILLVCARRLYEAGLKRIKTDV